MQQNVHFELLLRYSPPPYAGSAESDVGVPVGEKILGFHNKGVPGKNIYTKSTNVIVSCRETCARSERVNLYERQIMILPRKTKTYAMSSGSGPPSEMSGPGNLYRLSLVSSTPSICSDVDTVLSRGASSHNDRYWYISDVNKSKTFIVVLLIWLYKLKCWQMRILRCYFNLKY